ncbi:MAG: B3/B4 domain-containing protein [Planctomycetota bacterium]|jgi:DNA/RNA-binding domain of Phe-tRNA-synthetase-like protein
MSIRLETDHVALGVVRLEGITIPEEPAALPDPSPLGDVQVARRLYRSIGIDPTKNRPSSEALLRRLKRGEPLPRINALVDVVNHCSVTLLLPFGCYDLDRVVGEVVLRVGREDEWFEGLGKPRVNVGGRYTLADEVGPFGNPSMDSRRTMITPGTENALVVVFAPPDDPFEGLPWVAETLRAAVAGDVTFEIVRP